MSETVTQPDIVLDVYEVARRLKCHPDTVYALIRSGQLRAKRLGKQRAIRVPVKALEDYLNSDS
jgi:excisionase family DNA binding protein